jgi:type VI secretion system protein ImpK
VARELARLKLPPLELPSATAAPRPGAVTLSAELAKSIGADVEVSDVPGGAMIVLKSDRVFASGSVRPDPSVIAVIQRVATALSAMPGAIIVSGHTDDQPIRTARFPSNWELSTERARSVLALMAPQVADPARLRAEGLADSEPLVPNDTVANRAKNRRVAILLRSGP